MTGRKYFHSGENKYLFIDGGAFDSLLVSLSENLFRGEHVEVDYKKLTRGYKKVFYYDCMPAKKKNESEQDYAERVQDKTNLFNDLKSLNGFHVYEGTARYRDRRRGQEQKQVDIMIAVDMLTHSFRRNMDEATLLTGDLDFKPLIDALVQDGMYVTLWYPKGRTNHELIDAADSRLALTVNNIKKFFTESFSKKAVLPTMQQSEIIDLDSSWIKESNPTMVGKTEVFIYEKAGKYAAVAPINTYRGKTLYNTYFDDDKDRLKFYVKHVHEPNMYRERY